MPLPVPLVEALCQYAITGLLPEECPGYREDREGISLRLRPQDLFFDTSWYVQVWFQQLVFLNLISLAKMKTTRLYKYLSKSLGISGHSTVGPRPCKFPRGTWNI